MLLTIGIRGWTKMNDLLIRLDKLGFQVQMEWGGSAKSVQIRPNRPTLGSSFDDIYCAYGKTPEAALKASIAKLVQNNLTTYEKLGLKEV